MNPLNLFGINDTTALNPAIPINRNGNPPFKSQHSSNNKIAISGTIKKSAPLILVLKR